MSTDFKYIFVIASVFVLFFGGLLTGKYQTFPYSIFEPFVQSVDGLKARWVLDSYNHNIRWKPDHWHKTGVTTHIPGEAYGDATVFTTAHDQKIRLIDMNGQKLHEWALSFNALWPEQQHLYAPKHMDDSYFYLRDVHLFADGSLITIFGAGGLTPWGAGMVKLDKDSNVIWKIADYFYNRFTITPDGRIYALRHQVRTVPFEKAPDLVTPLLEDTVTIISPDGNIEDSIPVLQAFLDSDFASFTTLLEDSPEGDYTHSNSINVISRDAANIPWLKKGYLLLSLRNASAFAVIDPATKKVVHAAWLPARRQHDIKLTLRNTFLLFDNQGHLGTGGISRVLELDPVTLAILHSIEGKDYGLSSKEWGAIEEQPNGNLLITDAESSRLLETAPSGKIVWEYFFAEKNGANNAVISAAYRFKYDDLPFLTELEK